MFNVVNELIQPVLVQRIAFLFSDHAMRLYKRAAKMVLAALPVDGPSGDTDPNTEHLESLFGDCDDDVADPTYCPSEEPLPPSSRDVRDHIQHCEYVNCMSDVYAACFECNSFLCWAHFEDPAFANDCRKHLTSSEFILSNMDCTDYLLQQAKPTDTAILPNDQHQLVPALSLDVCDQQFHSQQCEYLLCTSDVFTTCLECQSFLCSLHFEECCTLVDCSKHRPFSKEICTDKMVSIKKKTKKESAKKAAKRKRNNGLEYMNWKKRLVAARCMKPPCGTKCRLKCYDKITEVDRQGLFETYWALGNITRQRDFIHSCTEIINRKSLRQCDTCCTQEKMRANNYAFYFNIDLTKVRVCKEFFKATLDINDRVINTVRSKTTANGFVAEDLRGKHSKPKLTEASEYVREFINSIPRIESHYLRAQTSREYIEGSRTLSEIYNDYKLTCDGNLKQTVSKTTFSNIFKNDFNISFFIPKKDRCELCVSYENSSDKEKLEMEGSYTTHLREKKLSREAKSQDKRMVSPTYVVACYDLQAVLTTPRGDVSVFYYISKLATYNLSVCELVSGLSTCFVWHEGQGNRGVTEIGSCIWIVLMDKAVRKLG